MLSERGFGRVEEWTRLQPIRTAASVHLSFKILSPYGIPKYMIYREKIIELRRLGMTYKATAEALGITEKMVWRVIHKYKTAEKDRQTNLSLKKEK